MAGYKTIGGAKIGDVETQILLVMELQIPLTSTEIINLVYNNMATTTQKKSAIRSLRSLKRKRLIRNIITKRDGYLSPVLHYALTDDGKILVGEIA